MTIEALLETRDRLFQEVPAALDANERECLRTLVEAKPTWSLLGIPHLEELPAIRWGLQNLQQLRRDKPVRRRALGDALDQGLQGLPGGGPSHVNSGAGTCGLLPDARR